MKRKYAVGIDIGGSHISSVLVDMENGALYEESYSESKLNNQALAEEILLVWGKTFQKSISHVGLDQIIGIGFAMPGPFDYEKGIAKFKGVAKYDNLYGLNVGEELRRLIGLPHRITFRFINDAFAFAIGESWSGKAAQFNNVVAITLGTGFGSAFIKNGVPVIEGEQVPPMGYVYNIPYKTGIADDYFSTRWFINEYELKTGVKCNGVKDIADLVEKDQVAKDIFNDFGKRLGEFLSPLLKNFNADCLVIGGNIAKAYKLFEETFQKELRANERHVKVVISDLMETAAMTGSARLLNKGYWENVQAIISKI